MGNNTGRVKATATTFRVIEALREEDGVRLTPLAGRLDMSTSSLYKYLRTLQDLGYVVKENKEYRLGLGFADIGGRVITQSYLYSVARPQVERLTNQTDEMTVLFARNEEAMICLHLAAGEWPPQVGIRLGEQFSLIETAIGHTVLAYLATETGETLLDDATFPVRVDDRSLDRDELATKLETIRDRGLAFERSSSDTGRQSVSAPITDTDGVPRGALTIAGPADRVYGKRLKIDLSGLVQTVASEVSNSIVADPE